MIKRGPRQKQATSLHERLARFAREVRERAVMLPPGEERAMLMEKLELTQRAVQISECLGAPTAGVQAPRPARTKASSPSIG
jgi:hypothetical protein